MNVSFKASTLLNALHVGGFLSKMETRRTSVERPDKLITISETETTVADLIGDSVDDPMSGHDAGSDLAEAIRYIKTGEPSMAAVMLSRIFDPVAMGHAEQALRA